jgi:trigger factor
MTNDQKTTGSSSFTKHAGCFVELNVTLTKNQAEAAYKNALKYVGKDVSIPGFRKGKTPENIIKEKFAKQIEKEWKEELGRIALSEGFEEGITPAPFNQQSLQSIDVNNLSKEGATVLIKYESYPEIPAVNLETLTLQKKEAEKASEKDIEEELRQLQYTKATWNVKAEDAVIVLGDFVDLNIFNLDNNEAEIASAKRFSVENERMGKWLLDLLLGQKAGSNHEAVSQANDTVKNKESFVPTRVRVEILQILQAELPEINDALANACQSASLEELKNKIIIKIENERAREIFEEQKQELLTYLKKSYIFDLPQSICSNATNEEIRRIKDKMAHEKISKEEINALMEKEKDLIEEEQKAELRLIFLMRKVAQDYQITIDPKEVEKEIMMRQMFMKYFSQPTLPRNEIEQRAANEIMEKNIISFLIGKSKLV